MGTTSSRIWVDVQNFILSDFSRLRCDRPDRRSVVGLRSRPDRSMLLAEIEQLRRPMRPASVLISRWAAAGGGSRQRVVKSLARALSLVA
jgi:hypothetical protein